MNKIVWIFCCGLAVYLGYMHVKKITSALKSQVNVVVREIAGSWNIQTLKENAVHELVRDEGTVQHLFSTYRNLGNLIRVGNTTQTENNPFATVMGKSLTWQSKFETECQFENAGCVIITEWIRRDGEWKIIDFAVRVKGSEFPSARRPLTETVKRPSAVKVYRSPLERRPENANQR